MTRAHSILSPSGASRWMECTPSAVFESKFDFKQSNYADEGTFAHALAELMLKNHFQKTSKAIFNDELKKAKKHAFYNAELHSHCLDYVNVVIDYYERLSDTQKHISLEVKLDLSEYIPNGIGHLDVAIYSDNFLHIIDFKYGKGVLVEAEKNKQLMIYALGALNLAELHNQIDTVRGTIYQPRLNNHSSFEMSKLELLTWAYEELKPKALKAHKGEGSFVVGDHCKFCRAKNECKALYDYNIQLAQYEFKDVHKISDDDISYILSKKDIFKNWLNSIEEYALNEAINNNKKWPNFKLVEGRSNRILTDKEAIIKIMQKNKINKELYLSSPELLGISKLENNLGSNKVNELIGNYIHKPPGSPTLVDENDKRSALNADDQAKKIFNKL